MKIINFRAFLCAFAMAAAGILFSLVACYALPLGIALLAVLFVFTAMLAVHAAVKKDFYKLGAYAVAFAITLYLVVAFFVILATRYELENGETYALSGRVTERFNYDYEYDSYYVLLDNLKADGKDIDGRMLLVAHEADKTFSEIECGYRLGVRTKIFRRDLVDGDGVHARYARTDERYYSYGFASEVFGVVPGTPAPLESVHISLRERLIDRMGEDAGRVAYGMIAGDKFLLDDEITDAYSSAGIGHLLAVSGLHIGLISLVLCFLLFRLPLPRNVSRAAVTLLLLAYVIFAGGSPSAVRAFVMCAVGIWAAAFGKRDNLNALCLGATVCLCITPFYLFECGYLMSVCSVFGLVAFAKPLREALVRLRIHRGIAGAVAASFAAQIAVSPVIAFFFHRFYFWSFFVNALGMALLSVFFMVFVVFMPFGCIPPLGSLLTFFGFPIGGLTQFCQFVGTLPLAEIVWQVSPAVFLLLPLAFGLSRFVMLKRKRRFDILLLGLCAVIAVVSENSVKATDALLAAGGNYAVTVIYRGDEKYLFGRFELDNIERGLDENRIGGGRFIVCCDELTELAARNILKLRGPRQITEVRFPLSENVAGIKTLTDAGVKTVGVTYTDVLPAVAYADGIASGWLYSSNGRTAYVSSGIASASPCAAADVVRCLMIRDEVAPLCLTDWGKTPDAVIVAAGKPRLYDFATGKCAFA